MLASKYLINTSCYCSSADSRSHRYMLSTGMIIQTSAGIYLWGPLGTYILRRIEDVIRDVHTDNGIIEFIAPTLQSASYWKESGRYDAYGEEALRIYDRKKREYLYGPTAEEMAVAMMKNYKDQQCSIFNIQWKFRDEKRPRNGLLRGREFLMKDAYSFHYSKEEAIEEYILFFNMYMHIFSLLELKVYPFESESGVIGGNYTHEFIVISNEGENNLYYDKEIIPNRMFNEYSYFGSVLGQGDPTSKGIEVGQIFYLGNKYTNNEIHMGCYGIGVSRLVQVIVDIFYDDENKRMRWPQLIRQFDIGLIDADDKLIGMSIYEEKKKKRNRILYDDTKINIIDKANRMKMIGVEHIFILRENEIKYLNKDNEWVEKDIDYILNL